MRPGLDRSNLTLLGRYHPIDLLGSQNRSHRGKAVIREDQIFRKMTKFDLKQLLWLEND